MFNRKNVPWSADAKYRSSALGLAAILCGLTLSQRAPGDDGPCRIEVVEEGSGWPVPLVQLTTISHQRFVSDNAGVIAVAAPDLLNREVFFHVAGHGYEVPKDAFGFRGVRLELRAGDPRRVEVVRTSIARRLGRLTGAGLFAESQICGQERDWEESGVTGCDSVQTVVHQGKRFWIWGDTALHHYPLGIFHASGATTNANDLAPLKPPLRLPFDYFRDARGIPRDIAKMPGNGPTWLSGVVSLPDQSGRPRLGASYVKIDPPLDVRECGLCVWNEKTSIFEPLIKVWTKSPDSPEKPPFPDGHAARWRDEQGQEWLLFGNPLPRLQCLATFEDWQTPGSWRELDPQETLESGNSLESVRPQSGSIAWSDWRRRWIAVFTQKFGTPSGFGEIWYAEADAPTGPWGKAIKVLSHDNYTFYNPRIHSDLSPDNSPVLLFEGTFTEQFADHAIPTPRYDYNQILYQIDLDDSRLAPAHERRR